MELKLLSASLALLFLTASLVMAEEIEEKPLIYKVSISSTFYVQIFRSNIVLAAFSSYNLALAKN